MIAERPGGPTFVSELLCLHSFTAVLCRLFSLPRSCNDNQHLTQSLQSNHTDSQFLSANILDGAKKTSRTLRTITAHILYGEKFPFAICRLVCTVTFFKISLTSLMVPLNDVRRKMVVFQHKYLLFYYCGFIFHSQCV